MAALAMKRIFIVGLRDDRKAILEALQRQGLIEVQSFTPEDEVFQKRKMPISAAEFEHSIHDSETALEILTQYDGEKPAGMLSSFKGRAVISEEDYDGFKDKYLTTMGAVTVILARNKDIAEKKADIIKYTQQMDMLEPWKSLDISLGFSGTSQTSAFVGALTGEWSLEDIYAAIGTEAAVDVDIVSKSKEQTCIVVLTHKDDEARVSALLRGAGFVYPAANTDGVPRDSSEKLAERIRAAQKTIEEDIEDILSFDDKKNDIRFLRDYLTIREEKYSVINNIPQSEYTFALSGYVPEKYVPKVERLLEKYNVVVETEDPAEDEDTPVLLSNNAFSASVQGVVEAYALPLKGEIDPTFLISLFYFIFFGFMLADAAIGILMVIATLVLLLVNKNMERGLRNNVKLFLFGGISTIFWGVLFGSYFGDMIPVVSETFFGGKVLVRPVWLDMTTNPMAVLSLSLAFGIIHIFTGLGVAGYQMLKKKDIVGFLSDIVAWVVILAGLIVKCLAMPMIMGILFDGRDPFISESIGNIGLYAAGVGAVVVIIMGGRESKNPLKRLLKGAYAVYGITSYLSDVLSYSRLLALGLATGVISSVANMMGTMFGSGVVRVIVYLFVFIVINAVNIGINTLGAYVHTNRLQYVEFFGKFYEGGGRPFQPFSIKTKYYKFKENDR